MKNKFLLNKLLLMQQEYKQVLEQISNRIDDDKFWFVVDEINLFWYRKRKLVKLILNNISRDFNGFLFTGATYLDIKCNEQFPFIIFGKEHIIDDPLNKYASIISKLPEGGSQEMLKEQIRLSIDDNLKVLNECYGIIHILPVTLLTNSNDDLVKSASEKAFLSLFNEQLTIKQVMSKFKTLEDMVSAMQENVTRSLMFFDDENVHESIITRFNNYRKEMPLPYGNSNDVLQFIFTIMGFFSQAMHILLVSREYKLIPYLRYNVTFNYTTNLSINFKNNDTMKQMIFKSACAHLLYKMFDIEKIKSIDFIQFVKKVKDQKLYDDFFLELNNRGINADTANLDNIKKSMKMLLEKLYN